MRLARAATVVMLIGAIGAIAGCGALTSLATAIDRASVDSIRNESPERFCVEHQRYAEYIARDLVAFIDSTYRTARDRSHRGIAGLSMGGWGAMTLALSNPDIFGAAASHSGVLVPTF